VTQLSLMKLQGNVLIPHDPDSIAMVESLKIGALIGADFKKTRNPQFHKKYMVLLTFAYEQWEPAEIVYKEQVAEKNFDKFRKDIAILAGYGYPVINIKGEVRYEAKSISFANMDENEFAGLYSNTINVIMKHILTRYTKEDLDDVVFQLLNFS